METVKGPDSLEETLERITHISVMSSLVKTKCPACEPGTGKDFEIIIHHLAVITDSVYQSESQLLSDLKAPRGWFPDRPVQSAVLIPKAAIPEQCRR